MLFGLGFRGVRDSDDLCCRFVVYGFLAPSVWMVEPWLGMVSLGSWVLYCVFGVVEIESLRVPACRAVISAGVVVVGVTVDALAIDVLNALSYNQRSQSSSPSSPGAGLDGLGQIRI